ncbi:Zinicin-like metallopeptidase [Thermomonospora echinospora]|uniref:Zinicin-like metallopeptidase n=1 Tax=Thermomonospora echinospora TaxID=1992 RepID=A0A1H5WCD7_9ACTN|nr:metallopeptidase family protein [Thermomonospora echinospora]SEF97132.1 Zinicin-like metallopeptidase [Thermomonospora echinospora]
MSEKAPGARIRRRDRHGRGVRGPLMPPEAPFALTRAERFDGLVRDEVNRLGRRWGRELAQVEFAVEDVPRIEPLAGVLDVGDPVPLSQTHPAANGRPPRIVVFRRPLEARAGLADTGGSGIDERELTRLVRDVLVEEVADLLGLSPESVDPSYDSPDD